MRSDTAELMQVLEKIDSCYKMHDDHMLREDLMEVFLFINAAVLFEKVDAYEVRVLVDLYSIDFICNAEFVSSTMQLAMSYVMSDKYLPKTYKEDEYITPLRKLEEFLLSLSTQVAYSHGARTEEVSHMH